MRANSRSLQVGLLHSVRVRYLKSCASAVFHGIPIAVGVRYYIQMLYKYTSRVEKASRQVCFMESQKRDTPTKRTRQEDKLKAKLAKGIVAISLNVSATKRVLYM